VRKGIREIAGRFFVFGAGTNGEKGAIPPELLEWSRKGVSGVIFFARNLVEPLQVWNLTRLVRELFPFEPFIMSDEEGGDIKRLTSGVTRGINAFGLAATGNPENARRMTQAIGEDLRAVGINTALSPVLDVNSESENPIIGSRAFSDRPETVIEYARPYAQGFKEFGILTVGKHFPGHGPAKVDSHLDLPVVDLSRGQLEEHLRPFATLVREGLLDMILSAHILYPQISDEPATLSRVFLTEILRKDLEFDGLAITDCMEMNAMKVRFGVERATVRAFNAGMDLILISHTPELQRKAMAAFIDAVESGEISYRRVEESLERIERVRSRLYAQTPRSERSLPFSQVVDYFGRKTEELDMKLAEESIAIHHGEMHPYLKDEPIFVFDFMPTITGIGEENTTAIAMKTAFGERFAQFDYYTLPYAESAKEVLDRIEGKRGRMILITRTRGKAPAQKVQDLLNTLCERFPDNLHVSGRDPYDISVVERSKTAIATFGLSPYQLKGLMRVLSGDSTPKGRMPTML
jgi:beta-N-acetylhexosaminidase